MDLVKTPAKFRKNLLFVRGGRASLHRKLYSLPSERSWDLLFTSYESLAIEDFEEAEFVASGGISKWCDFSNFLRAFPDTYKYIWVSDDDIDYGRVESIDACFAIAEHLGLFVCQPSLSARSFSSWKICQHSASTILRFTSFVECMMPIFSRHALTVLKDDIDRAVSGCGLDLIFWHALGRPQDKMAIIDSIQVDHVKPIDTQNGDFYKHLRSMGVNPKVEVNYFLSKYGLQESKIYITGVVPKIERHVRFENTQW
jgi:hypothetical protein